MKFFSLDSIKYFLPMIGMVLALSLAGTKAQAQGYELRCRGGKHAFAIDQPNATTLSLNFNASQTPARADGSGLAPGTCSWIDRTVNDKEPRQIQFMVSVAQAKSIPVHLKHPNNYWSFFVINTNKGFFKANNQAIWEAGASAPAPAPPAGSGNPQPPGQTNENILKSQRDKLGSVILPRNRPDDEKITKPPYGNEDLRLPAIRDLIFSPTMNGATVTFIARPGPIPVVEIDKKAPFKDSLNHASFNPATVRFNPVAMKNKSTPTGTAYAGGSYQTNITLDQGTLYHYIITVPIQGSTPYQQTGSFTTLSRTVKVTFTQIYILSSAGDLYFQFNAEAGPSTGASRLLGSQVNELKWKSGHKERLRDFFPLVVGKAGDRLKIWVEGTDDDGSFFGCLLPKSTRDDPLWFEHLRPHKLSQCDDDVNYAKGEFDLSKYPGKFVNIPFTLQSMTLGPSGVKFMFDVSGYIEFTNPDIP